MCFGGVYCGEGYCVSYSVKVRGVVFLQCIRWTGLCFLHSRGGGGGGGVS
jgi:hypothetical protein